MSPVPSFSVQHCFMHKPWIYLHLFPFVLACDECLLISAIILRSSVYVTKRPVSQTFETFD